MCVHKERDMYTRVCVFWSLCILSQFKAKWQYIYKMKNILSFKSSGKVKSLAKVSISCEVNKKSSNINLRPLEEVQCIGMRRPKVNSKKAPNITLYQFQFLKIPMGSHPARQCACKTVCKGTNLCSVFLLFVLLTSLILLFHVLAQILIPQG